MRLAGDRSPARVVGTGLAFAGFGLGALALAAFVFPLCRITARSRQEADDRVQHLIHRGFRLFRTVTEAAGLMDWRSTGLERLRVPGPRLVVANHPTLIDVVHLVAELPQADCVVNEARTRNPFLGLAARAAGYLPNREGAKLVEDCADRLRAGRTVLLFPEGTRSPAHGLHAFHRGAAHVALAADVPLRPVAIRCDPPTLAKGSPFWAVPARRPAISLHVLEPLDPRPAGEPSLPPGVAARRLTARLRARLEEQVA